MMRILLLALLVTAPLAAAAGANVAGSGVPASDATAAPHPPDQAASSPASRPPTDGHGATVEAPGKGPDPEELPRAAGTPARLAPANPGTVAGEPWTGAGAPATRALQPACALRRTAAGCGDEPPTPAPTVRVGNLHVRSAEHALAPRANPPDPVRGDTAAPATPRTDPVEQNAHRAGGDAATDTRAPASLDRSIPGDAAAPASDPTPPTPGNRAAHQGGPPISPAPVATLAVATAAAAAGASLLAPILALIRKRAASRVLSQPTRRALLDAARDEPGIPIAHAAKRLGLHYTTAEYHARILAQHGHLRLRKISGAYRLLPDDAPTSKPLTWSREHVHPTALRILETLREAGAVTMAQLQAASGVPRSSLQYHLRALASVGAVSVWARGTKRVYALPHDAPPLAAARAHRAAAEAGDA